MTETSPPGDIESIRREIDGIDRTLLNLITQRLQLAERLGASKADSAGPPIRPGREISLLRSLIQSAQPPLERELVIEIWRALISASLRKQRIIDVVVGGGRADPTRLFDIARRHFGARTRIQHVIDPQDALRRAAEKPDSCVAVTPWPGAPGVGAWWPALTESRFHKLHLIAGLPVMGAGDEPEAAVFAASPNEEAGGDVTLMLAEDPHHRLQRALADAGLSGRELSRSEPRVILRIDGFLSTDDPRAVAITGAGLERVRVLGSYARI
jgi:chorismate mutase/prephenate dehydratase